MHPLFSPSPYILSSPFRDFLRTSAFKVICAELLQFVSFVQTRHSFKLTDKECHAKTIM